MKIFYGTDSNFSDVTIKAFTNCFKNGVLNIPAGDCNRAVYFGDPSFGILKHIKIINDNKTDIYNHNVNISISINYDDYVNIMKSILSPPQIEIENKKSKINVRVKIPK